MSTPSKRWVLPVEWTKVREFALATGAPVPDPIAGPVPLTFPTYGLHAFGQIDAGDLGLAGYAVIHGEEEYEFRRPLRIGDRLTAETRLAENTEKARKSGAPMRRLVVETEFHDRAGELVVLARAIAFAVPRSEPSG